MKFYAALLLSILPHVLGRKPNYERYAGSFLNQVTYIDPPQSGAFGLWIQLADRSVSRLLKKYKKRPYTVIMPNSAAFEQFIVASGGNSTDPGSLGAGDWPSLWGEAYTYLFFEGQLDTTAILEGETVVLESAKKSPVGDWPLTLAFRRDVGLSANGTEYNLTVSSGPYTVGNITVPDYPVPPNAVAHIIDFWPTEPKNLSVTISQMGVSGWDQVVARLPEFASLETQQNFTLLLPPSHALKAALALSDKELGTFLNYHLIQDTRVILTENVQRFKSVAGEEIKLTAETVVAGSINATVVLRDVLTNGGIVQVIDRSIASGIPNLTTRHEEL